MFSAWGVQQSDQWIVTSCVSFVTTVFGLMTYDLSDERQWTMAGNYFEVTLLHAPSNVIGIGFAAPDSFPVIGQMPGWIEHSYGYHGDDGCRFTAGKSTESWPTWREGDIVGCGINFMEKSVFYTLNGALLGTAFEDIQDQKLSPVIGFHGTGIVVKINMGQEKFTFNDSDIVVHTAK